MKNFSKIAALAPKIAALAVLSTLAIGSVQAQPLNNAEFGAACLHMIHDAKMATPTPRLKKALVFWTNVTARALADGELSREEFREIRHDIDVMRSKPSKKEDLREMTQICLNMEAQGLSKIR